MCYRSFITSFLRPHFSLEIHSQQKIPDKILRFIFKILYYKACRKSPFRSIAVCRTDCLRTSSGSLLNPSPGSKTGVVWLSTIPYDTQMAPWQADGCRFRHRATLRGLVLGHWCGADAVRHSLELHCVCQCRFEDRRQSVAGNQKSCTIIKDVIFWSYTISMMFRAWCVPIWKRSRESENISFWGASSG